MKKIIGGSEFIRRSYTAYGHIPVKLISCSPSKDIRIVRIFDFN